MSYNVSDGTYSDYVGSYLKLCLKWVPYVVAIGERGPKPYSPPKLRSLSNPNLIPEAEVLRGNKSQFSGSLKQGFLGRPLVCWFPHKGGG